MRAFAQVLSSMKPRMKLPLMFTKDLRRSILAEGVKILLAVCGGLWCLVEVAAFFFPKQLEWTQGSIGAFCGYVVVALVVTIFKVRHQANAMLSVRESLEERDCSIEIQVGDIFKVKEKSDFIIGTNTDFDTDMSDGPISKDSLQGQFTTKCYPGRERHLYRDLEESLADEKHTLVENTHRQTKRYEFGTVAKVSADDREVYFVAIDELDEQGVVTSSLENVRQSLSELWRYIGNYGKVGDLVIPILGTKGAKIQVQREVMIIEIINSFIKATYAEKTICERLKIVVYEEDYRNHNIDLNKLRSYLHVHATPKRWQVEESKVPVGESL